MTEQTDDLRATVSGDFKYELPPPGMMNARCVRVIDLGTHLDPNFPKDDKGRDNYRHLIRVHWELDKLMDFDGEMVPMMVSQQYTLSAGKKANLRKDLESWYGKEFNDDDLEKAGGFDLKKILGKSALLNLKHSKDGKYANVVSVNPPMAEMVPQHYPSLWFALGKPDPDVWAQLGKKTREKIEKCEEVKKGQVTLPTLTEKPKAESSEAVPF